MSQHFLPPRCCDFFLTDVFDALIQFARRQVQCGLSCPGPFQAFMAIKSYGNCFLQSDLPFAPQRLHFVDDFQI